MKLDAVNAFLEALARLNDGVNHGGNYYFERLPDASRLDDALAIYFSRQSTSFSPAEAADKWQIKVNSIDGKWVPRIKEAANQWFFCQEFSPSVGATWVKENVVEAFIAHLTGAVGDANLYEVQTSPPMFYGCWWEEFAFSNAEGNWLLHFGFSD